MRHNSTTKQCSRCGQDKPHAEFYVDKSKTPPLNSACIPCCKAYQASRRKLPAGLNVAHRHNTTVGKVRDRKYRRMRRFGITSEKFDQMLAAQRGLCANPGCGRVLDEEV